MTDVSVTKGKKILLVDDAAVFLVLAGKMLEHTGLQIFTARNGIDALRLVQSESPDVVVLDLVMPEMAGDKVCSMIKSDPATRDVPIIMVTSRGRPEELERCRQAGCDDFLTKPMREDALISKICELVKVSHRHSVRIVVRMERQSLKEVAMGTSRDVSKTGILVDTGKELEQDEEITLRFFLNNIQKELTVTGKVVRKERSGTRFRYGIQFVNQTLSQKRILAEFLESPSASERTRTPPSG